MPGSIALERSQGLQNAILQGSGQKKGIHRRLQGSQDCGNDPNCTPPTSPPLEKFQFFYHGDHLGSSSFITDDAGAVYQHLEYFPYGETWIESGGTGQMPYYRFTGKELDPETGLYYYGARYYDPVLSRWISADPILAKYLPNLLDPQQLKNGWRPEQDLPGYGGIYRPLNLNLFRYGGNNPVYYLDADGNADAAWKGVLKGTLKVVVGVATVGAAAVAAPAVVTVGSAVLLSTAVAGGAYMATSGSVEILGSSIAGTAVEVPTIEQEIAKAAFGHELGAEIAFGVEVVQGTRGMYKLGERALIMGEKIEKFEAISTSLRYGMSLGEAVAQSQKSGQATVDSPAGTHTSVVPPFQANPNPPGSKDVKKCHGLEY